MRDKVKFKNIDDVLWFTARANNLVGDLNIYDGSNVYDAKSLMSMTGLDINKTFELGLIAKDPADKESYALIIERYGI